MNGLLLSLFLFLFLFLFNVPGPLKAVEIDAGRKCTTYVLPSTRVAANCTAAPEISSESPSHGALLPSGHRGASEINARSAASVLSSDLDEATEVNGAIELGALPWDQKNKDIHNTMGTGVVYVQVRWYGYDRRDTEVCTEWGGGSR